VGADQGDDVVPSQVASTTAQAEQLFSAFHHGLRAETSASPLRTYSPVQAQ
jgi:hypothetical protein